MDRRAFLAAVVGGTAVPVAAKAQPAGKTYRVGLITPAAGQFDVSLFREGLRRLGYAEGANLFLDVRSAEGELDRLPSLASDLVKTRPDVVVAVNTPGARAAIAATKTIPIVLTIVGDPLAMGFVSNLAHPGGNVTGVSNLSAELSSKRLSLLKEAVPKARRIGVLLHSGDANTGPQAKDVERAAPSIGVEIRLFPVETVVEMPSVFDRVLKWRPDALLWLAGQTAALARRADELAANARLPVMLPVDVSFSPKAGLLSYLAKPADLILRTTEYVDKILKGGKPGDLPIEQPTKFELVINLKTAKALGLTISPALLARADQVIE